jgi:hypothetical protein
VALGAGAGVVHAQQPTRAALVSAAPTIPDTARELGPRRETTTGAPTTTQAPTTTTTVEPPAPPTTEAPAPPPAPEPPAARAASTAATAAPPVDGPGYALDLLRQVVPAPWLAALPVRVAVIGGQTSWSSWSGLIQVSSWHLFHAVDRAQNTLAHEWGHQVAWHYGTDEYEGSPPAGFPYGGRTPEEQWADCVAQVLTGTVYPSSGLGACPGAALSFTRAFLDAGPGPKLR